MAREDQYRVNGRFAKRKADDSTGAEAVPPVVVRVRLQGTEAVIETGSPPASAPAPLSAEQEQPEGIAASFVCPILRGLPIDPVVAGDVSQLVQEDIVPDFTCTHCSMLRHDPSFLLTLANSQYNAIIPPPPPS